MKKTDSIKTKPIKYALAALALLSTLNPQLSTCFAQGSLTPPGAPAPTMKSLDQVEARTPWSSFGVVINQPGSYYLTKNISVSSSSQHAIIIGTNNVTLDLNGFTISSTQPPGTDKAAIVILGNWANITILNGNIAGGVTNNAGTYNGPGFGYGINVSGTVRNVRVSGVSVSGCLYDGIAVGATNSSVVQFCTVDTVGGRGIVAQSVADSTARQCGDTGIYASTANNCSGECVGSGYGVYAGSALNCRGASSTGNGLYTTYSAQNCYGYSSSGSYGLCTITAENCYGANGGNGYGVYASSALNCRGTSVSSTGLYGSDTANNCYGYSNSGNGVFAFVAQNCYGRSDGGSGDGVNATTVLNYVGVAISGDGVSAETAQNCWGEPTSAKAFWSGTPPRTATAPVTAAMVLTPGQRVLPLAATVTASPPRACMPTSSIHAQAVPSPIPTNTTCPESGNVEGRMQNEERKEYENDTLGSNGQSRAGFSL